MKLRLLTIFISILFVSCEKDKTDDPTPEAAPVASVSMKVNGLKWFATKNTSALVVSTEGQKNQVALTGNLDGTEFFQMATAKEIDGPGTYSVPSNSVGAIQFWNSAKTYVVDTNSAPATVVISGIRTIAGKQYVKGTFSGWLMRNTDSSDRIEITEGEFNGIDP